MSDFVFETTCTGRPLEEQELRKLGLITDDLLRRTALSGYIPSWFEVNEEDRIRVVWHDDERELDETFAVPADLPNPPQMLDGDQSGMRVYNYLTTHCRNLT